VEQGWQPGSVRDERGRLAMCGVPAEPFCNLFQHKKVGAGRNYTRLSYLPEAINKVKPQPVATRRHAKNGQRLGWWRLTVTEL